MNLKCKKLQGGFMDVLPLDENFLEQLTTEYLLLELRDEL
jgi:hypothetical protein